MTYKVETSRVKTQDGEFAVYEVRNNDGGLVFAVYGPCSASAAEAALRVLEDGFSAHGITPGAIFDRICGLTTNSKVAPSGDVEPEPSDRSIVVAGDDGSELKIVRSDDGLDLVLARNGSTILSGNSDDADGFWYQLGLDGGVSIDEAERLFNAARNLNYLIN